VESEQENVAGGVTRGQNQLHIGHADWRAAEAALTPLLDRLKPQEGVQMLVITADADSAAGIAERLEAAAAQRGVRLLAATSTRRATRARRP